MSKKETKEEPAQSKEAELTETLQRLQAEFENFKKRNEKEKESFVKFATESMLIKLFDVIDTFELALQHADNKDSELVKGMELTYAKLTTIIEEQGVEQILPLNKPFDPVTCEALMTETSDQPPGTVIDVFQKGYSMHGRIIRHAKVKVAK